MSAITTHVLDTSLGRPAARVALRLERETGGHWQLLAEGHTDADGRCRDLLPDGTPIVAGRHRLTFATGPYFAGRGVAAFYPEVAVVFEITSPAEHHHVPLLLSPYGYSTYRGS